MLRRVNQKKKQSESSTNQISNNRPHLILGSKMSQDLPPLHGYPAIQWKRNIPSRGFTPKVFFALFIGALGYGWYSVIKGIQERRELQREKVWSRIHLMPLLIAEEDRDSVRRYYNDKKREEDIMGPEANEVKIYNDGKFRNSYFHWAEKWDRIILLLLS